MANALTSVVNVENGSDLLVHQLMHGYADGHRLVEGSLKLPDDLTRLTLRMSDLSGPNMRSGFEEYLTGYPLSSIDAYAFARTWYASEMPRPGCVWTHTLVIPATAMARIPSLGALEALFKRPTEGAFSGSYGTPIPLEAVLNQGPHGSVPKDLRQTQEVL